MCGIAGYLAESCPYSPAESRAILSQMRDALAHRGPDDSGCWQDAEGSVGLGHRRLSILDLSPDGHQPMHSSNSRYSLVYNGEVYNFKALRRELEQSGSQFRGNSDTEVLLEAFSRWNPEDVLPRLNGMFALALWDKDSRRLLLARDRFGKKPLYYSFSGGVWLFASELKSLKQWPGLETGLDQVALLNYLRFAYVPTPRCIYRNISKLPAGSSVWLQPGDDSQLVKNYWNPGHLMERAPRNTTLEEVESALLEAVRLRMVSDVPIGSFLSGGIDSSLISALMQELSPQPIRTFALGFTEKSHDEAGFARTVAAHLGTDHTEHYVSPTEALAVVPNLPALFDEPFADPSQIPTFLVAQMAKESVSVVLSGDGGDEIFGGYNRYLFAPKVWNWLRLFPLGLRRHLASLLERVSFRRVSSLLGERFAYPEEKLNKLAQLLDSPDRASLYGRLVSNWNHPECLVRGLEPAPDWEFQMADLPFAEAMMQEDMRTYLCDDILVKVDRATMAVGLEARAPYLDPEVCAIAWGLPSQLKHAGPGGKTALRQILYSRVPQSMMERPKSGFSLPLGRWLRTNLRPWAEDLLYSRQASEILNPAPIRQRWKEHLSGRRDWSASMWTVLMFLSWLTQHQGSAPNLRSA